MKNRILNIDIDSISLADFLEKVVSGVVFTPNVDHLMKLQKDKEFYNIYSQANWLLCDSKMLNLGSKFLKKPFKEVIPGSSLLPAFYKFHKSNKEIKIFLLGASEGVSKKARNNINYKVGWDMVVGDLSPSFGFEKDEEECGQIIKKINKSGANVLVVGVGAPKQEKWIVKYRDQLNKVQLFFALGATIDFEAENIQRAPNSYQRLSLEWFYRLLKEPKRLWKRYLIDDMPFFWLILKQKIGVYKNPWE